MTERERFEFAEKKLRLYYERKGRCEVCDRVTPLYQTQLAHRIPSHKKYLARYTASFIHSPLNLALVCSLHCNSAVLIDPASHPVEADALYDKWLGR